MGSGKTNYAVNELLEKTTYKHVVCNVPLTEEYKKELTERGIILEIFDKLDPKSVIDKINSENPQTFFIIDEAQLTLTSANVAICKRFAKQMSQIRQDDQDVNLIAQTSKMLPSIIKEVATDCYKFENNNIKGFKKSSSVSLYKTGYDYSTRKISEFTYNHVYGKYSTSNWNIIYLVRIRDKLHCPVRVCLETSDTSDVIFNLFVMLFCSVDWLFCFLLLRLFVYILRLQDYYLICNEY